MPSTRSRISSIACAMASTASVPSSETATESLACCATSRARCAVSSAAARSSLTVADVWLIAADCSLALSVWRLTAERISAADTPISCTPAWISREISASPDTIVLRLPASSPSSGLPSAVTVAVRSPSATRPANAV